MSQPEQNSSRGKSRREGGKQALYKPGRDERDRSGYSSYRGKSRQTSNVDAAPPTILLKTRANETRSLSPVTHQVKTPSTPSGENSAARDSTFKVPPARKDVENVVTVPMTVPVKLLSEELAFQDSLHDFLGDNPDFLVIGCVGLQWSGKSSVLSHLAASE